MKRDGPRGDGKLRAWRHGRLRTCGHDFLSRKAVEGLIGYDCVACTFGELCEKVFDQQPLLARRVLLWRSPSGKQSVNRAQSDLRLVDADMPLALIRLEIVQERPRWEWAWRCSTIWPRSA